MSLTINYKKTTVENTTNLEFLWTNRYSINPKPPLIPPTVLVDVKRQWPEWLAQKVISLPRWMFGPRRTGRTGNSKTIECIEFQKIFATFPLSTKLWFTFGLCSSAIDCRWAVPYEAILKANHEYDTPMPIIDVINWKGQLDGSKINESAGSGFYVVLGDW